VSRVRGPRPRGGLKSSRRRLQSLRFALTRDRADLWTFLRADLPVTGLERFALLRRCWSITQAVRGYHSEGEILQVGAAILRRAGSAPRVVEAGCAYGSSTAKLSPRLTTNWARV